MRKSPREFRETSQHRANSQESSGSQVKLVKTQAWSDGLCSQSLFSLWSWKSEMAFHPGDILAIVTFLPLQKSVLARDAKKSKSIITQTRRVIQRNFKISSQNTEEPLLSLLYFSNHNSASSAKSLLFQPNHLSRTIMWTIIQTCPILQSPGYGELLLYQNPLSQ